MSLNVIFITIYDLHKQTRPIGETTCYLLISIDKSYHLVRSTSSSYDPATAFILTASN